MSKVSALITHKSVCTGPMRLSHAITCPFSKYFQIFSNFVQNFKHFALFLPLLNIFCPFCGPFLKNRTQAVTFQNRSWCMYLCMRHFVADIMQRKVKPCFKEKPDYLFLLTILKVRPYQKLSEISFYVAKFPVPHTSVKQRFFQISNFFENRSLLRNKELCCKMIRGIILQYHYQTATYWVF